MHTDPYNFFDFQKDEDKLRSILNKNNIVDTESNRWFKLYGKWRTKSKEIEKNGVTNISPQETLNVLDLYEMHSILEILDQIPTEILKLKWNKIRGGDEDRLNETQANSESRNTQFELLLLADLKKQGVNCELCKDNPDILVRSEKFDINIECKRIVGNSKNTVQRNVRNASKQLIKDYKNNGNLGVIALSIERIFSGGNKYLDGETEQSSLAHIKELHNKFINTFKSCWSSKASLGTEKIPMVIIYTSTTARLNSSDKMFAHITECDSVGTLPSDKSRKNMKKLHNVMFLDYNFLRVSGQVF